MTDTTVDAALRDLNLPGVASWYVETGPDATGDAAVWVWLILQNEGVDRTMRSQLRDRVRQAVREVTDVSQPWTYVRFRTVAEEEMA